MFKILNETWSDPLIVNKDNIYTQIVNGMKLDLITTLQECIGYLNEHYKLDFPDGVTISDCNLEYEEIFDELRSQSNRADILACQGNTLIQIRDAILPYVVHINVQDLSDYKIALYGSLAKWQQVMQTSGIC
ncbi:MAG: hypothetical protein E4G94_04665 [ANME-2 cluster archaeon]|nr:MAG: hypothetical protein E4G94_04665 [ANME-2 cluster archaeon]